MLEAWRGWHGDFTSFCEHVSLHLRLEGFGDTTISSILFAHGERRPERGGGRSRDEDAIRRTFLTFFPNAQWVGDGTEVVVTIDGQEHHLNLELVVDTFSDAFVGTSVRDTEDAQAVVEAFAHGVATTGQEPLALLLDNRPSNHTDEVGEGAGDTLTMRSTAGRGQSKAHVEGAFGLFSQYLPPLILETDDPRELARNFLRIVAETVARVLNRRPRRDRSGKSRVDLNRQPVTDEEREAARKELEERLRKQEAAWAAREARTDPETRQLLDSAFDELGLLDPGRFFRRAIACYPLNTIVDGIAVFKGKRRACTLPERADARYLLGIVRNLHHVHESNAITLALLEERLHARDALLLALVAERDSILGDEAETPLLAFVDRTLAAHRAIDRIFWIHAAAAFISGRPEHDRPDLFRTAARRIHATFHATRQLRSSSERLLLRAIWPIS